MVARLKVGDEVATAGGIIGLVTEVDVDGDPEVLLLEVAQGVELAVLRRGIAEVRYIEGEDDEPGAEPTDGDGMAGLDSDDDAPRDRPTADGDGE